MLVMMRDFPLKSGDILNISLSDSVSYLNFLFHLVWFDTVLAGEVGVTPCYG